LSDADRPLTGRGRRNAGAMGAWISSVNLVPDRILCSPAARTRETLDLVTPHVAGKPAIDIVDDLYLAGPLVLLKHLHALKPRDALVLVIGHNPGLHALALDLIAEGPQLRIAALGRKLPTCGLVVVGFDIRRWRDVVAGAGTLMSFTTPAELG
jgi:phosphohistidine phosphatase